MDALRDAPDHLHRPGSGHHVLAEDFLIAAERAVAQAVQKCLQLGGDTHVIHRNAVDDDIRLQPLFLQLAEIVLNAANAVLHTALTHHAAGQLFGPDGAGVDLHLFSQLCGAGLYGLQRLIEQKLTVAGGMRKNQDLESYVFPPF